MHESRKCFTNSFLNPEKNGDLTLYLINAVIASVTFNYSEENKTISRKYRYKIMYHSAK
jgi:hypothetical protein